MTVGMYGRTYSIGFQIVSLTSPGVYSPLR